MWINYKKESIENITNELFGTFDDSNKVNSNKLLDKNYAIKL